MRGSEMHGRTKRALSECTRVMFVKCVYVLVRAYSVRARARAERARPRTHFCVRVRDSRAAIGCRAIAELCHLTSVSLPPSPSFPSSLPLSLCPFLPPPLILPQICPLLASPRCALCPGSCRLRGPPGPRDKSPPGPREIESSRTERDRVRPTLDRLTRPGDPRTDTVAV